MSRSYQKTSFGKRKHLKPYYIDALSYASLSIPNYNRIRMIENNAIHKEKTNSEYGEILFPQYRGLDRSSWFSTPRHHVSLKNKIRNSYFLEIRNILNGYFDGNEYWSNLFIEEYKRIKGSVPDNGRKYKFEWLNIQTVRKIIKEWNGEPLDVLKYLTNNGFIEQMVSCKYKKIITK